MCFWGVVTFDLWCDRIFKVKHLGAQHFLSRAYLRNALMDFVQTLHPQPLWVAGVLFGGHDLWPLMWPSSQGQTSWSMTFPFQSISPECLDGFHSIFAPITITGSRCVFWGSWPSTSDVTLIPRSDVLVHDISSPELTSGTPWWILFKLYTLKPWGGRRGYGWCALGGRDLWPLRHKVKGLWPFLEHISGSSPDITA